MIYIGYGLFAISIGFFIGASNSPVVVAYLAAIGGLVGAIFGALKITDNTSNNESATYVGKLLSVFAVGLIIGELIGESHRNNLFFHEYTVLPWGELDEPKTTREALDWLMVKSKMNALGYQDSDVLKIYSIRLNELQTLQIQRDSELKTENFTDELTTLYDVSYPLNEVLPKIVAKRNERGLASVNE